MDTISFDDFLKVELRVGRIVSASVFAQARKPAYVLHVDFGDALGVRKSSAQVTALYEPEDLIGKLVVAVVNFPSKQVGPLMSECLVTGSTTRRARWYFAFPISRFPWEPGCYDGSRSRAELRNAPPHRCGLFSRLRKGSLTPGEHKYPSGILRNLSGVRSFPSRVPGARYGRRFNPTRRAGAASR